MLRPVKYFLCTLLVLGCLSSCVHKAPTTTAASAGQTTPVAISKHDADARVRQWYNQQVDLIPVCDLQWEDEKLSLHQRAEKAFEMRHLARVMARVMMQDPAEVKALQDRDMAKYGNPNGPTFDYLVTKQRRDYPGITDDDVYRKLIGSSQQTSAEYNKKYGVKK